MHFKYLFPTTCFLWLVAHRTADEVWIFCAVISGILSGCTFFYGLENRSPRTARKEKGR